MIIPVPRRFVSRDSADRFIGVTRESSIRQRDVPGMAADMPLLAAAGILGLIPGLTLVIFMRNHLARGFSMGRVV